MLVLAQRQTVGRQLLEDKFIVRQIVVEGPNHIVAISVGIRKAALLVENVTFGVSIAGHVEPVSAPALAVLARGQQPIDESSEGIRDLVCNKRACFFLTGRQTEEVKVGSADQRAA